MTDRRREIVLSDDEARRDLARRTRRSFLAGGLAAVGGFGAYEWITRAQDVDNAPWPQRKILDLNGKISRSYLSNSHLMPEYATSKISPIKVNGGIGINPGFDPAKWRLDVANGSEDAALLFSLEMADIVALPRIEMTTLFCCIEGWSVVQSWAGARFSDFTKKYFHPGQQLPRYVYMATPDEDYYVGLDMKSALHPQTLLAYEHNGQPLEREHGAPLRLIIPVKYGIKNIKRIGLIRYTDDRPDDYWAEEGYDWFAGL
jgi:DMSO/TMAO reductase YedYZ molybdopterin-dependent catalytic subunit